jgi:hypothetical protein
MCLIPHAIARLLSRSAVIAQAVGFDDQAQLGPEEVDAISVHHHPRLRNRQLRLPDQAQKSTLEL